MRILELGNALGDLDGAALGHVLRVRRRREGLAGDLAGPHIGGTRRHAEQCRIAHEFAPIDLLVRKLFAQLADELVLFLTHFGTSPFGHHTFLEIACKGTLSLHLIALSLSFC